jgi:adenylate cyclase
MNEREIERKFFVREMPDLTGLVALTDERYFLYRSSTGTIRFQKRGFRFELERMTRLSDLERTQEKWSITEAEFEALKALASAAIVRDSFLLQDNPQVTIKVYRGRHEGLVRAEIEFPSADAARAFAPPEWMGREMTDTPLAHDSSLLDLDDEAFARLLTTGRVGA